MWTLPSRDFVKGSRGYDQHEDKPNHHEEQQERVASELQKSAEESMGRAQIGSQKGEFITSGDEDFFWLLPLISSLMLKQAVTFVD